jgi:hypothetical protein
MAARAAVWQAVARPKVRGATGSLAKVLLLVLVLLLLLGKCACA